MSDDSNGSQPDPAGKKEEEEERGENAGHPENPAPEDRDSWAEDTSESESTTEEEGERVAGGETGKKQIVTAEDGFRTPTSSEHRIPAITECPPAPRKPHPSRWKRSRSPHRCLEFDTSEEVESLFRPEASGDEGGGDEPESKRARKGDDGDEGRA